MFPLIFLMGVRSEVLDLIASRVAEICEIEVQLSEKAQLSDDRRQMTENRKEIKIRFYNAVIGEI